MKKLILLVPFILSACGDFLPGSGKEDCKNAGILTTSIWKHEDSVMKFYGDSCVGTENTCDLEFVYAASTQEESASIGGKYVASLIIKKSNNSVFCPKEGAVENCVFTLSPSGNTMTGTCTSLAFNYTKDS